MCISQMECKSNTTLIIKIKISIENKLQFLFKTHWAKTSYYWESKKIYWGNTLWAKRLLIHEVHHLHDEDEENVEAW